MKNKALQGIERYKGVSMFTSIFIVLVLAVGIAIVRRFIR